MMPMNKFDKIYIAGHRGMVGSAIARNLQKQGFENIVTKTSVELDLRTQEAVNEFFETGIAPPQQNTTILKNWRDGESAGSV